MLVVIALGRLVMLFTIFTPIYNRKSKLYRVWDSLNSQSLRDFEWIVVDDGSTDGVDVLIEEYRKNANFPIKIGSSG